MSSGVSEIRRIVIPFSYDFAFAACSGLTEIKLSDSVTSIGLGAFDNCPNLTPVVNENSYAEEYARSEKIPYKYSDPSKA